MTLRPVFLLLLICFLFTGCESMDPEDREFYSRNILHPGMDAGERNFWYLSWGKPDRF